jgi:hypothetical protein
MTRIISKTLKRLAATFVCFAELIVVYNLRTQPVDTPMNPYSLRYMEAVVLGVIALWLVLWSVEKVKM